MMDQQTKDSITSDIGEIMNQFNGALFLWQQRTGCTANFQWGYGPKGEKHLLLTSIDMAIYRREAPSPKAIQSTLGDILKAGAPS